MTSLEAKKPSSYVFSAPPNSRLHDFDDSEQSFLIPCVSCILLPGIPCAFAPLATPTFGTLYCQPSNPHRSTFTSRNPPLDCPIRSYIAPLLAVRCLLLKNCDIQSTTTKTSLLLDRCWPFPTMDYKAFRLQATSR